MLKKLDSPYEGRRSTNWLKVKKWDSDRCRVVGYTPGEGRRSDVFGALILAKADDNGKLKYVGKVGSGFNDIELHQLFKILSEGRGGEPVFEFWVGEKYIPVDVSLEVTVKYFETTRDGVFRFPSLLKDKVGRNMIHLESTIRGTPPKVMDLKALLENARRKK